MTKLQNQQTVLEYLNAYVKHLQTLTSDKVVAYWGTKYWKVVFEGDIQNHVHSFVDKQTGDLLKAETWAKPAKGVRFNLITDALTLERVADPYGSYLYKR